MTGTSSVEAPQRKDAWHVQGRARRPEGTDYNKRKSTEQEMNSEMVKRHLIPQDLINLG